MNKRFFIFCCLFILAVNRSDILKCGEEQIENCLECGKGEASNTCAKCKDKYFLFFHNLYCVECNNATYGQVGCSGNCDGSRFSTDRFVYCNKDDCEEGFYNLEGICFRCADGSPGCKKCKIQVNEDEEELNNTYVCEECLNNQYLLDKQYGICVHCSRAYCSKCHYDENENTVCDKCYEGFYLSNNECKKCHDPVEINNGKCRVCSDVLTDYNSGPCWCNSYYTQSGHSTCVSCPENCPYCTYNTEKQKTECLRCDPGYALNSEKTCTSCGEGCEYCFLNEDSEPVCSLCFSRTFLSEDKKCLVCPNNCKRCQLDENDQIKCIECYDENALSNEGECLNCPSGCKSCYIKDNNELACKKCHEGYALKGDEECISCSDISEIGGEKCKRCGYNKESSKYECYECKREESNYDYSMVDIYTYVTNTFQCFNNSDPNATSFYGCLTAYYNEENGKYECLECSSRNSFIPIKNEKICKLYYEIDLQYLCLEAENIGTEQDPKYSCANCPIYGTKVKKSDNTIDCYYREDKYAYCSEGEIDENYIRNCTKCVPNSHLNSSSYCECDSDSFGRYLQWWCHKCDDKYYGNPGCDSSRGCNYYTSNDQLNCKQCKNDYFSYSEGQCYSCQFEIDHCNECHFNNENQKLFCDKCDDGYYFNETENRCVLNDCQEYPDISPGCIICKDKFEEYKSKKICHSCNHGYFKTKENKCIYCRSEEYGGPDCLKCGYDDNNENIKCKYCPLSNYLLTSEGKCYKCPINRCQLCNLIKDQNENKLECSLCEPGYYVNSKGECISYLKYIKPIPKCRGYYYNINNVSFYLYSYSYYDYDYDYDYSYNYSYYSIYRYYNHSYNDYYDYYYNTYSNLYDYIYYAYKYDFDYKYSYYFSNIYLFRENYTNFINNSIKIPEINSEINAECVECEEGYYKDDNGNCIPMKNGDCSILSIIQNFPERFQDCRRLCGYYDYAYLDFLIKNNSINYNIEEQDEEYNKILLNLYEIFYGYFYDYQGLHYYSYYYDDYYYDYFDYYYNYYFNFTRNLNDLFSIYGNDLKYSFSQNGFCVNTSLLTQDLMHCSRILYVVENDTYKCVNCKYDYYLDNATNICIYKYNNDQYTDGYNHEERENLFYLEGTNYCYSENKGTESETNYSCKKCYNRNNVLVTTESGINYCEYPKDGLDNCLEAKVDTTYINPLYNCTSCSFNYLPYYSEFFERKICQNIYAEIITEEEISMEPFNDIERINATEDEGKCEKNNYFTPDGYYCYPCNNEIVGMAGCKGSCNFSLKRNRNIKCEGGCEEEGFIESSEGICESCGSINKGCAKCHYETDYPENYLGIKRKRRFVCEACEADFIMSNGKCLQCSDVDLDHCDQCEINDEKENTFKCKKCEEGYVLENNYCYSCDKYLEGFIQNDKCYSCSDAYNGGISSCSLCEKNNNQVMCHLCYSDYILVKNNNTCLYRLENEKLKNFDSCEVLSLNDNNELYCSRCKSQYTLLKVGNEQKCEYIPSIYDYNYYNYLNYFYEYYDYTYYYPYQYNYYYYDYYDYYYGGYYHYNYYYHYYDYESFCDRDEDYNYYRNYRLYPCQEASNLGTEENPAFTCDKCYQYVDNDNLYYDSPYTRIINENNKLNYCIRPGIELYNCTEAINKTENGLEKYDCVKCTKDNILIYNGDLDIHYCQYINKVSKCVVKFCKSCKDYDNYFCSVCLLSDYEVNKLTGSCVKKAEIVPAITWKDVFRLQLNSNKVINGKTLYGPSLRLRGITNSQINSRHAFLIYLTFKLKTRTRNLDEDEKKIPTICEALNNVDEVSDDLNIIDYECIGNTTGNENLNNYALKSIDEGDNEGMLKESNLAELAKEAIEKNLITNYESNFALEDLMNIRIFEMNEVKNQESTSLKFDFTIDGKLNKELASNKDEIKGALKLAEIEEEADCTLKIGDNKTANLNCKINLEKYKDKQTFAFKTTELQDGKDDIYLSKINDISLIYNKQEEKKKNYTVIIIVCVICGVLLLTGISILIYFIYKKRKLINKNNNVESNEKKEIEKNINGENVIKFENNQNQPPKSSEEFKIQ